MIDPGLDFDVIDEGLCSNVESTLVNGVWVETPSQKFACHAKTKGLFVQFADGSTWGDYQTGKDVMARRAKNIALLSHLVDAYDIGGEAAFAAALFKWIARRFSTWSGSLRLSVRILGYLFG